MQCNSKLTENESTSKESTINPKVLQQANKVQLQEITP